MIGRILLTILLTVSLLVIPEYGYSLSSKDEYSDLEYGTGRYVCSYGYENSTAYKAQTFINQYNQTKGFWSRVVDYIKNKLGNKVVTESVKSVSPELKKIRSGGGSGEGSSNVAQNTNLAISAIGAAGREQRNIAIGSGTDKNRDASGKLITDVNNKLVSEVIEGTRYIYANANTSSGIGMDSISAAMGVASSGDVIIVMGGQYNERFGIVDGVSVLGGYSENGKRDATSVIMLPGRDEEGNPMSGINASNITMKTEFSGFVIDKMNVWGGILVNYSNQNLVIKNNTFTNINGVGIESWGSSAEISNNDFSNFVNPHDWDAISGALGILSYSSNLNIHNNKFSDMVNNPAVMNGNALGHFLLTGQVYGGITSYNSNDTIKENSFEGLGNGVISIGSTTVISNNKFYNNANGAIYGATSTITAKSNLIYNDTGSDVVYADWKTTVLMENNVIGGSTIGMSTHGIGDLVQVLLFAFSPFSGYTPATDSGIIISSNSFIYASESLGAGYYDSSTVFGSENPLQFVNNTLQLKDEYASLAPMYGISDMQSVKTTQSYDNLDSLGAMALSPDLKIMGEQANFFLANSNSNSTYSSNIEDGLNGILFAIADNFISKSMAGSGYGERELMNMAILALQRNMAAKDINSIERLNNILKNPTETTKMTVKTLAAVMEAIKILDENSNDPELADAQKGLMEVVSAMLLAQAMPDLLTETDVANIKAILNNLDTNRASIMRAYEKATTPYYEEMKKVLMDNASILNSSNILTKSMTKEELAKLSRSELDKLLEKIKQAKKKELDKIVQEESAYRKQYIESNKKILGEQMKATLRELTKSMSAVLEGKNIK